MVDNLEEEHMRRDVFTTAIETNQQISLNPAQRVPPIDPSQGKNVISSAETPNSGPGMKSPHDMLTKPRAKAKDKMETA